MVRPPRFFIATICTLLSISAAAQESADSLANYAGTYRLRVDSQQVFIIRAEKDQLILSIPGQGQAPLQSIGKNLFSVPGVKPDARIEFVRDSTGNFNKLFWRQDLDMDLVRLENKKTDSSPPEKTTLSEYTGSFGPGKGGRNRWVFSEENGHLMVKTNSEAILPLERESGDIFSYRSPDFHLQYAFKRNRKGEITGAAFSKRGGVDLIRKRQQSADSIAENHISNRQNGFTKADSLQGALSPLRSSYDVLFYHLNIRIRPEEKRIAGSNLVRFRVVHSLARMQVDLYHNMTIDSIQWNGQHLPYSREYNAVFIDFPSALKTGGVEEITIFYSGSPQEPDLSIPMNGGFLWMRDRDGNPWIESVCQGSGASLWWPCKDHLSDKPDSMAISITVPRELMDISNGRLLAQTELPGGLRRFDWYVSYPIINYDVAVNIGQYAQLHDSFPGKEGNYAVNEYFLPYHAEKAKLVFSRVKPMLTLYEKYFGPYPFPHDGFTVMESLYPMEHQSAVSVGMIQDASFDTAEMRRSMYHESAHEWWGNSVSCGDMADLWIHEAFATYAEYLVRESLFGRAAATASINQQGPANKEPIIGVYGVNHIHYDIGDMYSKGSLMLNTLRNIIHDDNRWFSVLRGLQEKFRYQTVTTGDIIGYINEVTGTDYTYFFDQYLRETSLPVLHLRFRKGESGLTVDYRWDSTLAGFHMPVRVTVAANDWEFITPTPEWKILSLGKMREEDFRVAVDEFLIRVKKDNQDHQD